MLQTLTTLELARKHPEVFNTLPEPYQNDSCLTFYRESDEWYADYDLGGTYKLIHGHWYMWMRLNDR